MALNEQMPPVAQRQAATSEAPPTEYQLLLLLQKGQEEQLRLLQALRQEVDALRTAQSTQAATVAKMDRQLRWARWWRLGRTVFCWLLLFGAGFVIYSTVGDWNWLFTWWDRLVWLFT